MDRPSPRRSGILQRKGVFECIVKSSVSMTTDLDRRQRLNHHDSELGGKCEEATNVIGQFALLKWLEDSFAIMRTTNDAASSATSQSRSRPWASHEDAPTKVRRTTSMGCSTLEVVAPCKSKFDFAAALAVAGSVLTGAVSAGVLPVASCSQLQRAVGTPHSACSRRDARKDVSSMKALRHSLTMLGSGRASPPFAGASTIVE
jgi:hypothetical protein